MNRDATAAKWRKAVADHVCWPLLLCAEVLAVVGKWDAADGPVNEWLKTIFPGEWTIKRWGSVFDALNTLQTALPGNTALRLLDWPAAQWLANIKETRWIAPTLQGAIAEYRASGEKPLTLAQVRRIARKAGYKPAKGGCKGCAKLRAEIAALRAEKGITA